MTVTSSAGGDPHPASRAPDKRKPATSLPLCPLPPPETPPMMDPTLRFPRLTPNLRDMIHGFSQGIQDASVTTPMHDFLSSPDPTAMYNSMQFASPILRDIYPAHSPVSQHHYDQSEQVAAERAERMTGACAEMNALFGHCYTPAPTDPAYRNEYTQEQGVISLMSSPELRNDNLEASPSGVSSTGGENNKPPHKTTKQKSSEQASQTSSQTPPPVDTSSSSPSNSSPDVESNAPQQRQRQRRQQQQQQQRRKVQKPHPRSEPAPQKPNSNSSSQPDNKPKRPSARPSAKSTPSATGSSSASASGSLPTGRSTPSPHPQMAMSPAATALMTNAAAMNPAIAGMMPFACPMPPGMGAMLPAPGAVHYQGRPMAFVASPHGTEMIPMDMLAQATALQYGAAAQAAVNRMMQPVMGQGSMPTRTVAPSFEPVGGSRKKRRRQLLERSGCSEEQARQNRAHALKRLRQKKTLRSQQSKVRYACRKRIAMVRPRVNGRFATKEEVEECERARN